MKKAFLTTSFLAFYVGCSNSYLTTNRNPASIGVNEDYYNELKLNAETKGQTLEFPSDNSSDQQFKMWHMTEGSDIYPLYWLLNLKSFLSNDKGSLFFKDLDKKYGLIKSPYSEEFNSPYAWVGVTAVWDGEASNAREIFYDQKENLGELPLVRKLANGKPSIAMVGANCSYCHTGSVIGDDGKTKIIDGAPATIDMKGYYYDIIGSTYQTMFNEKEMIAFYDRLKVKNGNHRAIKFVADLKREMGVEDTLITEAITLLMKTPFLGKKLNESVNTKAAILLYQKKEILTKYLVRMLKESFELQEITPLMQKRMEYLSWFGAPNPDVITTPEGYGRTDAFGRISNATIRSRSYTHLTAPVSLPPMYGMKYKAMYHYNANTNSLVSRNVGQAFGLGAVVIDSVNGDKSKMESTVDIKNLYELEKHIYRVPVPEYARYFPKRELDKNKIITGCNVYLNKCATCHEASDYRVGPAKKLIDHQMISLEVIDTDSQYLKNISKDALGLPFKKAIFNFTDQAKDGYYAINGVDLNQQKIYSGESMRGPDFFRDTFLGENRFTNNPDMQYGNAKRNDAFAARHLAGVWATAPYLHNGSVKNIYELLLPDTKRAKKFVVGNLTYDHEKLGFNSEENLHKCTNRDDPYCFDTGIVGNSNTGHKPSIYGGELKNSDKFALIEFLKVLTPELEYSWKSTPVYKIENGKCELR